jgi:uncharacterized protein (TIGR03084 family)
VDVIDDLQAEQERLEAILELLEPRQWMLASAAEGWTVSDVVLHLAQTEEGVVASASASADVDAGAFERREAATVEEFVDAQVRSERPEPQVVFARWKQGRRRALQALREADPSRRLVWAAAPLKPMALATTRLAEHWAHGLDITGPLGIPFEDTERLRHVAWLAHRSLPYSYSLVGETPHEVYCELEGPAGGIWRLGDPGADSRITGPGGDFCRVGARRLAPEDSALEATGPYGESALKVLRNYAR